MKRWSQTRPGFGRACVGDTHQNWEVTSILLHHAEVALIQRDLGP